VLFARYAIDLPADYDMARIRDRVAAKASHWDRRAGLLLKAFCVAERGRDGATRNRYAPFYLWRDPAELTTFLTGGEYAALADSFGPVTVNVAQVLQATLRDGATATSVVCRSRPVDVPSGLTDITAATTLEHEAVLAEPGVVGHILTLDPRSWTQHCYTLLDCPEPPTVLRQSGASEVLSIVHLARPAY
jgi:hypothetical protein